jgi:hypothetical protein
VSPSLQIRAREIERRPPGTRRHIHIDNGVEGTTQIVWSFVLGSRSVPWSKILGTRDGGASDTSAAP